MENSPDFKSAGVFFVYTYISSQFFCPTLAQPKPMRATPRPLLLTILFLLFSISTFSQQHSAKTLLWRITGKGQTKPSYLFGTMHLTDKRIFNFGDSVYRAIENTDGLAIEISPDEMGLYYANKLLYENDETKSVKEVLSKKEFKRYNAALAKKFGKPADEVTTGDVLRVKNQWIGDMLEKGEMSTFVDAFLCVQCTS